MLSEGAPKVNIGAPSLFFIGNNIAVAPRTLTVPSVTKVARDLEAEQPVLKKPH